MDLITLNEQYQQKRLIENWDSLIWSERFNKVGDFQLITGNVEQFKQQLPEGTVVSLRESTVPMIVKRHQIIHKKRQPPQLVITGKEFTQILDQRITIQSVTAALAEWKVVAKIPSDVAHFIIYKICVEGVCDPKDIFPADKVQFITPDDYMTSTGPNREFVVQRGKLLDVVLGLIQTEAEADGDTTPPSPEVVPHGIRAMRPDTTGTAIGIEIYTGQDKTGTVRFEASRDHLDEGSYLFSKEGSASNAYVLGPTGAFKMHKGDVDPSGLDRRVILVDGTSSGIESGDALKFEGSRALSDAHETALFDGSINQDLRSYIYGQDYGLGDIVKMVGDYGLDTKSRVTEYIRSEDNKGLRAYPTLEAIEKDPLGAAS